MSKYDLVIIGAGWAGFNAALEVRKLGKSVCLIEKDELGGTCLNRGCIPTKILTHFAKKHSKDPNLDLSALKVEQKDVISKLKGGMDFLVKSKKIDLIKGSAKIISLNKILIKETNQEIDAEFILISTGAVPRDLPFLKFDGNHILSSDDMLRIDSLPKNILIVGGGVIGCEFACAFNKLGSKVTIVEVFDRLVYMFDKDISQKLEQNLKKSGIAINTNYDIKGKDLSAYDKVLLCVGRKTNFQDLFDEKLGIKINSVTGCIETDKYLRTSISNIYAAGDCIGGLQLAHVASYEAKTAVCNIFSNPLEIYYSAIPSSVFTSPELAQVGINEEEVKKQSKSIRIIKNFFLTVGMAHIIKETDGFLKLIVDKDSDIILGASIVGPQATELINTVTLAVKFKFTTKQLKDLVFAHPSISEIFTETVHA